MTDRAQRREARQARDAEIVHRYGCGQTSAEIMAEMDLDKSTVWRALYRKGLTKPQSPEPPAKQLLTLDVRVSPETVRGLNQMGKANGRTIREEAEAVLEEAARDD